MAIYDLRILLETVQGRKTSYFSSGSSYNSFVNTNTDGLVLSSSQAYGRITGSVSCSFQNDEDFTGVNNNNFTFKQNNILSASLVGSQDTGSIHFIAKTDEYDRLLRYKFIGDKVCTVLGLPSNQWVYVDQFRLPSDDEANVIQGNMNIGNAFVSDTMTFANNANVNSDIPFYIDTGSDRYIKFIDTRDTGKVSLIFGYDKDTDTYEINASTGSIFNIKNVNTLQADRINAAQVNMVTSSTETSIETSFGDLVVTGSTILSGTVGILSEVTLDHSNILMSPGNQIAFNNPTIANNDRIFFFEHPTIGGLYLQTQASGSVIDKSLRVGTTSNSGKTLTVEGDISASGDIITTGDVIAENYIVKSNVTQITTSFSEGSTQFGDTPADDTHQFTGSVFISGSGVDLNVNGTGSFGRIAGTGSMTEMILAQDITTALASDVGAIADGTTISAGTSIESILRQILIDFLPATLDSFTVTGLDSSLEIMETDSVSAGTFDLTNDSLGSGFSAFTVALTNNTDDGGSADNTLSSFSANIGGKSFTFTAKTIRRTTPGTVTFTPTATFSNGAGGTSTDSTPTDVARVFAPLFVGASSNGSSLTSGGGLNTVTLDSIMADISGSVSESETYLFNSSLTSFGTQCYLGSTSSPTTTSNQSSRFNNLDINPPTDAATGGNYLYIVYPASFEDLTKLEQSGVGDLLGGSDMFKVGDANHTRENTAVSYRVYRSNLAGAFNDSQTLTISATG